MVMEKKWKVERRFCEAILFVFFSVFSLWYKSNDTWHHTWRFRGQNSPPHCAQNQTHERVAFVQKLTQTLSPRQNKDHLTTLSTLLSTSQHNKNTKHIYLCLQKNTQPSITITQTHLFSKLKIPSAFMTDIAAVVAAAASSRGIGSNGDLVWRVPADMSHFKKVTMTPPQSQLQQQVPVQQSTTSSSSPLINAVIMGRKTWESIPSKFRPLENRMNVILSRSPSYSATGTGTTADDNNDNIMVCTSLQEAITKLQNEKENEHKIGNIFLIGGGEIYKEGIESGLVNKVIYTKVDNLTKEQEDSFDTWFPELKDDEWICEPFPGQEVKVVDSAEGEEKKEQDGDKKDSTSPSPNAIVHTDAKSGVKYQFLVYQRKTKHSTTKESNGNAIQIEEGPDVNPEEMQYLQMCREIIENGVERGDRTGTGTLSKFGTQMRFSLRDGTLPLLTTKRTFWRGVAEELLWFVAVCDVFVMIVSLFFPTFS